MTNVENQGWLGINLEIQKRFMLAYIRTPSLVLNILPRDSQKYSCGIKNVHT